MKRNFGDFVDGQEHTIDSSLASWMPENNQAATQTIIDAVSGNQVAAPTVGASLSSSTVTVTTGGITFDLIFDSAAMAAPATFRAGVVQAATILANNISDKITVNIKIDYSGTGGGAAAGPDGGNYESYTLVRSDLLKSAAPGDAIYNSLPSGSAIQGQSKVAVWNAQLKLFGLLGANDTTTDDGSAVFATDINPTILVGVVLHELTHALGRVPYGPAPDIFDLFRYTSLGVRLFQNVSSAPASYFSLDGGVTKLADFGQNSDPSDFLNSGVQGPTDSFNEFYSGNTSQTLTSVDRQLMHALGYHVSNQSTINPPSLASVISNAAPSIETLINGAHTNISDLTVRVSLSGTGAIAGDTVHLYNGIGTSSPLGGSHTIISTDIANGYADVQTGTLTNGITYTLTARITDVTGNQSAASTNSFTVTEDNTAPALTERLKNDTGSSSSDHITKDATLTGSGDANALVHFYVDGNSLADTVTADASGTWTYSPTGLTDGQHTIVAMEIDAAGNIRTASLTLMLDHDLGEQAALSLSFGDITIHRAQIVSVHFTVGGLNAEDTALITFTDSQSHSTTKTVSANGATMVDLTGLEDGTITASMQVQADIAGNTFTSVASSNTATLTSQTSVERFFDSATGDHFYSLSPEETAQIRATLPTYHDEGAPWSTPDKGTDTTDVFRFFDAATGTHFFTQNTVERDYIISHTPALHYEGIAFQAYSAPGAATITLERFFNTITHLHTYAASVAESASILAGGAGSGWVDEGASFIVHA